MVVLSKSSLSFFEIDIYIYTHIYVYMYTCIYMWICLFISNIYKFFFINSKALFQDAQIWGYQLSFLSWLLSCSKNSYVSFVIVLVIKILVLYWYCDTALLSFALTWLICFYIWVLICITCIYSEFLESSIQMNLTFLSTHIISAFTWNV